MFKKLKDRITSKVMSASTVTQALSGNIDKAAVVSVVRDEVTSVVKTTLFHYFVWMNLAFGLVGFSAGCFLTWLIV